MVNDFVLDDVGAVDDDEDDRSDIPHGWVCESVESFPSVRQSIKSLVPLESSNES